MPLPMVGRSYFEALDDLNADEQRLCYDFLRKFMDDPSHPSISLERASRARSKNVWSGRVSRDLRAIVHQDRDQWSLLYVGHHDDAYGWAERRDIGRHSVTGALQVVETIESVREVEKIVVRTVERIQEAKPPLSQYTVDQLLSWGVPEGYVAPLRSASNEDAVLQLATFLPQDVAERVLMAAAGEAVEVPKPISPSAPVTTAPDTHRSFLVAQGEDELKAALDAPWAQWIAFLHPSQRYLAVNGFSGPVMVTGSAGTGKTIVAVHRARNLARQGKRVLLTTYVNTLVQNIDRALKLICTPAEKQRITVATVHSVALDYVRRVERSAGPAAEKDVKALLEQHAAKANGAFELPFILSEWEHVIRAQGIASWDAYAAARRTGRGRALSQKDRKVLWEVFGAVLEALRGRKQYDWPFLCVRGEELLEAGQVTSDFDAVVVDELQDLKSPEIRFLARLPKATQDGLMLIGDAGQRIYPGGFSLRALGIDVRGRSRVLRINYRTTDQIRRAADRMVGEQPADEDQALPARKGTLSLVRGPEPALRGFASPAAERAALLEGVRDAMTRGVPADGIGVFVRTNKGAEVIVRELNTASVPALLLADTAGQDIEAVRVGTMHRAKGLEFRTVFVLEAGADNIPDPRRMRECLDDAEREDLASRERRLLYVAMTRARDELTVSWTGERSTFLEGFD